ncbi:MAG: hypothetical protein HAW63_05110 [Bdellovibrionaceae bacterium]|nr:hypothetical protein [Pseudobdellovibrionaceae bacterium]
MFLLLPLIVLAYYFSDSTSAFLSEPILALSNYLHNFCLSFSKASPYEGLYQSLSCGKKLPSHWYSLFANSGLIHLIIISGLHISLIYRSLTHLQSKILLLPKSITISLNLFLLLLYTFMLNISAPALRAYFFQVIKLINNYGKLHWPSSYLVLLSVLLSLLFKPSLWASISLLLSWSAILIIYFLHQVLSHPLIPSVYKKPFIKIPIQSALLYLFLFPILSQFNSIHPFSIFIQILFTPLLLLFLIPLSILQYFFFSNLFFADYLWKIFFSLLTPLQNLLVNGPTADKLPLLYFWIYTISLQFCLSLFEVYIKKYKLSMKKNIHLKNHDL